MHIPNKGRADRREEGVPGLTLGGPRPLRHYREQPERMQGRREFQKVKINNQVTLSIGKEAEDTEKFFAFRCSHRAERLTSP